MYNAIKIDFVNLLNSSIKCHRHTSKKHGSGQPACINFIHFMTEFACKDDDL